MSKMSYLHHVLDIQPGHAVEVTLTGSAANVMLMDLVNFESFKHARKYEFFGGFAKVSPFVVKPPKAGKWHLVVENGGRTDTITANVRII